MDWDISSIYDELRNIIVIWETNEDRVVMTDFNTEEDVADFVNTTPFFIEKALNGTTFKGRPWNSNLFTKRIDEEYQYRFIIAYKEECLNYSKTKRKNRIEKLLLEGKYAQ